jgi:hypothetical protein
MAFRRLRGIRPVPLSGPDTEDSSCDRLDVHGRLNQPNAPRAYAESKCHLRLALLAEGLFREGRADATVLPGVALLDWAGRPGNVSKGMKIDPIR